MAQQEFDAVVINDDLQVAVIELESLMRLSSQLLMRILFADFKGLFDNIQANKKAPFTGAFEVTFIRSKKESQVFADEVQLFRSSLGGREGLGSSG